MPIYSFDDFENLEDMFEALRRDQESADARVQPWQAETRAGDYVVRLSAGIPVYSEILPDPENRPAELHNYRFTRSYSIACPRGELGDLHVSTIERKLSKREFLEAMGRGWRESGGTG